MAGQRRCQAALAQYGRTPGNAVRRATRIGGHANKGQADSRHPMDATASSRYGLPSQPSILIRLSAERPVRHGMYEMPIPLGAAPDQRIFLRGCHQRRLRSAISLYAPLWLWAPQRRCANGQSGCLPGSHAMGGTALKPSQIVWACGYADWVSGALFGGAGFGGDGGGLGRRRRSALLPATACVVRFSTAIPLPGRGRRQPGGFAG
jgi:hypothetical protein